MERNELIAQLEWNEGGYGFGICSFANSMIWAMDMPDPERGKNDLKSVIAVCGDPAKYTDDELVKIVEFSKAATARYDKMFNVRRGCNLILLDKREGDGAWMRKRMSWEYGPMYSKTLDEAIAIFTKEW